MRGKLTNLLGFRVVVGILVGVLSDSDIEVDSVLDPEIELGVVFDL